MFCVHCGKQINKDSSFCPYCGCAVVKGEVKKDLVDFSEFVATTNQEGNGQGVSAAWQASANGPQAQMLPARGAGAHGASSYAGVARDSGVASVSGASTGGATAKNRKPLIIGATVAVVAFIVIIAVALFLQHDAAVKAEFKRAHSLHKVAFATTIQGYNAETDTGIPVEIKGTDFEGNAVDQVYYINDKGEGVELVAGEYDCSFPASPLTESGTFYEPPKDTFHLLVDPDLPDSADGPTTQPVLFEVVEIINVTDDQIQKAEEYALKDPKNGSKAAANKTTLLQARQTAIAEKEAREAAERAAAQRAAIEGSLSTLDNRVLNAMTAKNASGNYEVHTLGMFGSFVPQYANEYSALCEEARALISDEDAAAAGNENQALGKSGWAAVSPELYDAFNIHVGMGKSKLSRDEETCVNAAYNCLMYRSLLLKYLDRLG